MVDETKCIACGACVAICPVEAIKIVNGKAKIDPKKCIACGSCERFCPVEAIKISKEDKNSSNNTKPQNK